MRRTGIGGVAAIDLGDAAQTQRLHIVAQQRPRLGAIVDEQREFRAARYRLDAERAGAGEEIEHPRALDRVVVGVRENVEDGLAQAICGRADFVRGRRRQVAAPQSPPDHPHRLLVPRLEIALAVIAALDAARRAVSGVFFLVAGARFLAAGALHQHAAALAVSDQRALALGLERLLAARPLVIVARLVLLRPREIRTRKLCDALAELLAQRPRLDF